MTYYNAGRKYTPRTQRMARIRSRNAMERAGGQDPDDERAMGGYNGEGGAPGLFTRLWNWFLEKDVPMSEPVAPPAPPAP